MLEVRYYVAANDKSPFAEWFADLDAVTGARIVRALARIEQGNFSNVKGVGNGVLEYRVDFGPGYRIYFGRDGAASIVYQSEEFCVDARRQDAPSVAIPILRSCAADYGFA